MPNYSAVFVNQPNFSLGEVKVIYKYKFKISDCPKITDAEDVVSICFDCNILDKELLGLKEQFIIFYLNNSNKIISHEKHSIGGISMAIVDPSTIMLTAAKLRACGVILVHTHPSGNTKASKSDIDITHKISSALEHINVNVLDHIIITPDRSYLSFKEEVII